MHVIFILFHKGDKNYFVLNFIINPTHMRLSNAQWNVYLSIILTPFPVTMKGSCTYCTSKLVHTLPLWRPCLFKLKDFHISTSRFLNLHIRTIHHVRPNPPLTNIYDSQFLIKNTYFHPGCCRWRRLQAQTVANIILRISEKN